MTSIHKLSLTIAAFLLIPFFSQATTYDIYVDRSNTGTENGTQTNPFNTIAEAITAAEENDKDNRKIYIANGEYREQLDLTDDVKLYGENKKTTIIYGKDALNNRFSYVIKMRNGTKIKDLQVKYGNTGVLVNNDDKATIEDCRIKDFKKIGVEVEEADRKDSKLFTMEDTKIYDGKGKGMYIKKRKININDNEIYDNEEEGIDLRSKIKGKIKNNKIYDNDESNIEMELKSANLKITNNDLEGGNSSGITLQYRGKNKAGKITLKRNDIKNNKEWGIRCSHPQKGNPPVYYFKDAVTFISNKIDDNKKGDYSALCNF